MTKRLTTLDALRGIAALAVAFFHFTNGSPDFMPAGILKSLGAYGYLGVECFFVISGFVIPYSLWTGGYTLRNYGRFVLKRFLRLDPPYFASILIVLVIGHLASLSPAFRGQWEVSTAQVLLHLGFLNVFFGYPWLNAVYWTLAIELQYYLSVGLLYPLILKTRIILVALAVLPFLLPSEVFVFRYLHLFLMGILVFRRYVGLAGERELLTGLGVLFAAGVLSLGWPIAMVGLLTSLAIKYVRLDNKILNFFGSISYSLYLLHGPIGIRVMNLSTRLPLKYRPLCLIPAFALSAGAAYLLYRAVELPAQGWSRRVKYSLQAHSAPLTGASIEVAEGS